MYGVITYMFVTMNQISAYGITTRYMFIEYLLSVVELAICQD